MSLWARSLAVVVIVGLSAVAVAAGDPGPQDVVRQTTDRLLAAFEAAGTRVDDPRYLHRLVDENVMPVVDLEVSTRLVLGRHWKEASEAQRDQFRDDLRQLLIRTYAKSLLEARGRQIDYLPFRGQPGDGYVTVDTRVLPTQGQDPLALTYCLRLAGEQWWLYDVRIEGVSLVRSLRTSFEKEIEQFGLDGFFENLSRRNREKAMLR